ncbi:MAG TPA: trypsin-like peptidase domain-containing protein [Nitrososphaerales archaeon]|nr:trypsin-like peptidase domain-containing protein [Nitrososphaerales archaeon]
MEVQKETGAKYWGALLVVVVIAVLGTYAAASYLHPGGTTTITTTASSDQSLINSLESQNAQLENELASKTQISNGTVLGLDTVKIYEADSAGVVTVQGTTSSEGVNETILGSGFVIDFSGSDYVVTNYHVVKDVSGITVTFQDGDAYPAMVVGSDGYSDLAVLNVTAPASEFQPLTVVSSSTLVVGQPVAAIGNPFGLSGSMTVGIVSQLGRTISESLAGNFSIADVIQFSAQINPGNSGGPLLNANGAVIGITTATVESSQGVGFAIPADTILKELNSLVTTGGYNLHAYMGISGADMNYQLGQLQKTNYTYGVLIESLVSGGPAQKAGLVAGTQTVTVQGSTYLIGGDIIVSINGTKMINTDALSTYLAEYCLPGQTLVLHIIRGGQPMTVDLVLGTRPPPPS